MVCYIKVMNKDCGLKCRIINSLGVFVILIYVIYDPGDHISKIIFPFTITIELNYLDTVY